MLGIASIALGSSIFLPAYVFLTYDSANTTGTTRSIILENWGLQGVHNVVLAVKNKNTSNIIQISAIDPILNKSITRDSKSHGYQFFSIDRMHPGDKITFSVNSTSKGDDNTVFVRSDEVIGVPKYLPVDILVIGGVILGVSYKVGQKLYSKRNK